MDDVVADGPDITVNVESRHQQSARPRRGPIAVPDAEFVHTFDKSSVHLYRHTAAPNSYCVVKVLSARAAAAECKWYGHLGPHPTIATLLGSHIGAPHDPEPSWIMLDAVLRPDLTSSTLLSLAVAWTQPRSPTQDLDLIRALISAGEGLAHMHSLNCMFADVKLENVLVDLDTMACKWVDFTQAGRGGAARHPTGTVGYMAPEQVVASSYTKCYDLGFPTDVWAFGIMVLEAFTVRNLDALEPRLVDALSSLKSYAVCYDSKTAIARYGPAMRDFYLSWHSGTPVDAIASKCLAVSPRDRPTMASVVAQLTDLLAEASKETKETKETKDSS